MPRRVHYGGQRTASYGWLKANWQRQWTLEAADRPMGLFPWAANGQRASATYATATNTRTSRNVPNAGPANTNLLPRIYTQLPVRTALYCVSRCANALKTCGGLNLQNPEEQGMPK
jgi:hypothetical protein